MKPFEKKKAPKKKGGEQTYEPLQPRTLAAFPPWGIKGSWPYAAHRGQSYLNCSL
jgi:hypothetical protein